MAAGRVGGPSGSALGRPTVGQPSMAWMPRLSTRPSTSTGGARPRRPSTSSGWANSPARATGRPAASARGPLERGGCRGPERAGPPRRAAGPAGAIPVATGRPGRGLVPAPWSSRGAPLRRPGCAVRGRRRPWWSGRRLAVGWRGSGGLGGRRAAAAWPRRRPGSGLAVPGGARPGAVGRVPPVDGLGAPGSCPLPPWCRAGHARRQVLRAQWAGPHGAGGAMSAAYR